MKKSDIQLRIIKMFIQKVNEKGYAGTNVNDIAHDAGVSIGTLYYHFKKGKLSLLMAIINNTIDKHAERLQTFGFSDEMTFVDFQDGLNSYLRAFLKMHQSQRPFIAAFDSEILSKLDYYLKLGEQFNASALVEEGAKTFSTSINKLIARFEEQEFVTNGKEQELFHVADSLTHQQVYRQRFGNDDQFLNLLAKIMLGILREQTRPPNE